LTGENQSERTARTLRQAFDRSFAAPVDAGTSATFDFLSIRVAGDPYALRLSELASLHVDRTVVRAPTLLAELRGMAAFRGVLAPVYDLGALLGYREQANARWLVLVQHPSPIALAFESFDAHLRVELDQISVPASGASASSSGAVRSGARALPVLHLPSIIEGIARRIKAHGPLQEQ
jgi:chemotaxis signal transduction protein